MSVPAMPAPDHVDRRRQLPSVDQALQRPELQALVAGHGRPAVLGALRAELDALRRRAGGGAAPALDALPAAVAAQLAGAIETLPAAVAARLEAAQRPSLVRVLNATGVVVHTNLGRAPLSPSAVAHVARIAGGYSNLEYDLESGERGSRESHVESRLAQLVDTEAALVVNNCAAAVLLAVNTLAEGRDVLVSRGELVEIGGSFRIPDVVKKGGARLVEVGTTNKTRLADFAAALTPRSGLLLKVHPSNFRIVGFTEEPRRDELAALAHGHGIPMIEDQGSGLLGRSDGLGDEPTVAEALLGGASVVTFSGDKLLGGPQAGIAAGRREQIEPMRKNPLYRALRSDKMTLAALEATLVEHLQGRAGERLPVPRMVAAPASTLETTAVALAAGDRGADALARALRTGSPPVVARVAEGRVLIDLRTIPPEEEPELLSALVAAAR